MKTQSVLLARLFPLMPADDRLLETRRRLVRRARGVVFTLNFLAVVGLWVLVLGSETPHA